MAKEVSNHTLQPTALVHEAYLRLVGGGDRITPQAPAAATDSCRTGVKNSGSRWRRPPAAGGPWVWMSPWMLTTTSCCVHEALFRLEKEDDQSAELIKLAQMHESLIFVQEELVLCSRMALSLHHSRIGP